MKKNIRYNDQLPPIRILLLEASDIYYADKVTGVPLEIENGKDQFHKNFIDLMPLNLDLYYLFEQDKLKVSQLGTDFFTYCIVNVNFEYPVYVNKDGERVYKKEESDKKLSKNSKDIRNELYLNGFYLNSKKYVRYKRSASSAKGGTCLFIRQDLYNVLDKWSKTGLIEGQDKNAFGNITSYEAYRALSLSSLIKTLFLNPYDILFVKDFEHILKDQEVIKVSCNEQKELVASKEICDVSNNLFDGEGLLDVTVFNKCDCANKGMMLLRNRFFKCCAFNTNLQAWFKHNGIKSVDQLNGDTLAKRVQDIVLVASESCLKYFKMTSGYSLDNIKRWCDSVSNESGLSRFGIVKTDKESRFFDGNMVETTYQLINTLQLTQNTDCRLLLADYIDYVNKIRNVGETPEYARLFLEGEAKDSIAYDYYDDDSEDQDYEDEIFKYNPYSFKSKVCFDLIKTNSNFVKTDVFRYHVFTDLINSFRLKIYNGRVLVHGTYATLFGNPIEYLKYIIKKDNKPLFDKNNISSTLRENEIYCSFFKNNKELTGSRAPHMTMGNLLYAKNKHIPEVDKWFNLSRNIVVVDAINNNIQQRLNGADYDSDSMLLTDNEIIVNATKANYDKFPVPLVAFKPFPKPLETLSPNKKENAVLNLSKIDSKLSNNKVGEIVNLTQKLNSYLWDELNHDKQFDYEELYNQIAKLAVLAGAEIDSAKRTFLFDTQSELFKAREYAEEKGYNKKDKPAFFFYISSSGPNQEKPAIGKIDKFVSGLTDKDYLQTSMDFLWRHAYGEIKGPYSSRIPFLTLLRKDIPSRGLGGSDYNQVDTALNGLINSRRIINLEKWARGKKLDFAIKKSDFDMEIERCYKKIKPCLMDIRKTVALFKKIEKEPTPHSLLFLLLYIISIKEKEIGYGYEDLFTNDGGVTALDRVKNKKAKFSLFNEYYYEPSPFYKAYLKIPSIKEENE